MIGNVCGLMVCLGLAATGATPEVAPSRGERNGGWANVSPEQKEEALRLFELGNQRVFEARVQEAIDAYLQALAHWDHPAIHYNLAMALRGSSSLLECRNHLLAAVKHGPEPFDAAEKFRRAEELLAEVEGELANIELSCDVAGERVMLDGREVLTCPGTSGQWVDPGLHVASVTKEGFSHPTVKQLELGKGQRTRVAMKLYRDEEWIHISTRFPGWVPWTVMGAGGSIAAAGAGLHWLAWQQGDARSAGALTLYAAGGVALITGATLLYFNAPRPYLVDPESGPKVAVTPLFSGHAGGFALVGSF